MTSWTVDSGPGRRVLHHACASPALGFPTANIWETCQSRSAQLSKARSDLSHAHTYMHTHARTHTTHTRTHVRKNELDACMHARTHARMHARTRARAHASRTRVFCIVACVRDSPADWHLGVEKTLTAQPTERARARARARERDRERES